MIVDGPAGGIKSIEFVTRRSDLSVDLFQCHWRDVHGPLAAQAPGLRRYVQNHVVPEAYAVHRPTHDGYSELWFDDLAALNRHPRPKERAGVVSRMRLGIGVRDTPKAAYEDLFWALLNSNEFILNH